MRVLGRRLHGRRRLVGAGTLAVLMLLAFGVLAAGCGDEVAEKVAEEAIERESSGDDSGKEDVDVDIDEDGGSVSFSDEEGESQFEAGAGASLPDGFPEAFVPPDGTVFTSGTRTESGSEVMFAGFETQGDVGELLAYYEKAADGGGYTIDGKFEMESGGTVFALEASKGEEEVMVKGDHGGPGGGIAVHVLISR